nr:MAG TPA: hypothetical protein [Bacteriophage sp.]
MSCRNIAIRKAVVRFKHQFRLQRINRRLGFFGISQHKGQMAKQRGKSADILGG